MAGEGRGREGSGKALRGLLELESARKKRTHQQESPQEHLPHALSWCKLAGDGIYSELVDEDFPF